MTRMQKAGDGENRMGGVALLAVPATTFNGKPVEVQGMSV